jgi:hypothetical protein
MSSTAYDDQYTYDPNVTIGAVGSTPNSANTVTINTAGAGGFVGGGPGGGGGAGAYLVSNVTGAGAGWANNISMSTTVLSIMAEGDGDAMIKTKKNTINLDEMARMMYTLKERMLILTPAFEKHEQYPALKEAYDHYKLIEALCREEETK